MLLIRCSREHSIVAAAQEVLTFEPLVDMNPAYVVRDQLRVAYFDLADPEIIYDLLSHLHLQARSFLRGRVVAQGRVFLAPQHSNYFRVWQVDEYPVQLFLVAADKLRLHPLFESALDYRMLRDADGSKLFRARMRLARKACHDVVKSGLRTFIKVYSCAIHSRAEIPFVAAHLEPVASHPPILQLFFFKQ